MCDEAAEVLPHFNEKATNRRTYFSKEAALALKARALLYQASDLLMGIRIMSISRIKTGSCCFSATKDKNKWLLAAEAAKPRLKLVGKAGKNWWIIRVE